VSAELLLACKSRKRHKLHEVERNGSIYLSLFKVMKLQRNRLARPMRTRYRDRPSASLFTLGFFTGEMFGVSGSTRLILRFFGVLDKEGLGATRTLTDAMSATNVSQAGTPFFAGIAQCVIVKCIWTSSGLMCYQGKFSS
jgi:hypothetical protein